MFVIVWRRSGIALLIYLAISAWIVSYWFDDTRVGNAPYTGWVLFYAAIATALHALALVAIRNAPPDADANPNDPDPDAEPPAPIWHHSLFFIPVVIWPLIFGGLSAYNLIGSDGGSDHETTQPVVTAPKKPVVQERSINFLNSSEDTIYYVISSPGGVYEKTKVLPYEYITRTCEPGKYIITALNTAGEEIYSFPSSEVTADKSKCVKAKNRDDKMAFHRIIGEGTKSEADCDDIWVIMSGARDQGLVDITAVCSGTITKSEVEKIDWSTKIEQTYDGRDIIEPLYEKDPGNGTYTVLPTGDDFPTKAGKKERIFALFSIDRGEKLTDEYLEGRILNRLPDIPEK